MNTQVQINDRLGDLIRRSRKQLGWTLDGDPGLRVRLAHYLSFLHQRFENWDLARHFARVVLRTEGIDDVERIRAHASLMSSDSLEKRWPEYVPRRMALEACVNRLEGRDLAFVAMSIGGQERVRGAFANARRWLELAIPIYEELDNLNSLRGRVTLGECLIRTGDEAAGVALIEDVRQQALDRGYLHVAWFAGNALSNARRTA